MILYFVMMMVCAVLLLMMVMTGVLVADLNGGW